MLRFLFTAVALALTVSFIAAPDAAGQSRAQARPCCPDCPDRCAADCDCGCRATEPDLVCFPPAAVARANTEFAWGYYVLALRRADTEPRASQRQWWADAAAEAYQLWDLWDDLRRWHEGFECARQRVARALGGEAYNRGVMPPPVPVWRWRCND